MEKDKIRATRRWEKDGAEEGRWWVPRGKHSETRDQRLRPPASPSPSVHRQPWFMQLGGPAVYDLWRGVCSFSSWPTRSQDSLILRSLDWEFSILNKTH